ncbi:SOS response-associated peptidase [Marinicrinis lubricantis]|uniref:Abasic site processing protein n=1 Tax=Marinicrinis lubricantis TaxID=2086470 RepID=A0ABW1IL93_9BACL
MCERFSLNAELDEITQLFRVDSIALSYKHRYNISPTTTIPAVISHEHGRQLEEFRWGLVPYWARDSINADCHEIQHKPIFERILRKQRCLIPCSGLFGWREEGKVKQPMRIVLKGKKVFGMAGIYDVWRTAGGEIVRTCTILTTPASYEVSEYIERVPVVLENEGVDVWLDRTITNKQALRPIFGALQQAEFEIYPVSSVVTNTNYDGPDCIERVSPQFALLKE